MLKSNFKAKRDRPANFSAAEEDLLVSLVLKRKKCIENKRSDAVHAKDNNEAWKKIVIEFNAACVGSLPRKLPSLRDKYSKIKTALRQTLSAEKNESKKTGGGPCKNGIVLTEAMQELAEMIALSAHGLQPLPGEEDACNDDEQKTPVSTQQRQQRDSDFEETESMEDGDVETNDCDTSLDISSNVPIEANGVILLSNEINFPSNQTQLVSFEHLLPSSSSSLESNAFAPIGVASSYASVTSAPRASCEDNKNSRSVNGTERWEKVNPAVLRKPISKALKRTMANRQLTQKESVQDARIKLLECDLEMARQKSKIEISYLQDMHKLKVEVNQLQIEVIDFGTSRADASGEGRALSQHENFKINISIHDKGPCDFGLVKRFRRKLIITVI